MIVYNHTPRKDLEEKKDRRGQLLMLSIAVLLIAYVIMHIMYFGGQR